jgi:hypothetical protein
MEFVELWRLLQNVEVDRVIEVERQATLVRDASKVLVDLGMPPILRIPRDPCTAGNVLEAVDIILCNGIRRCSLIIVISIVRPALPFWFILFS